jgi:hypothetical protein
MGKLPKGVTTFPKNVKCPGCQTRFNPSADQMNSIEEPAAVKASVEQVALDALRFDEPGPQKAPEVSEPLVPANDSYMPCHFCGEDIKKTAVKCRHCGEFLDESRKPQAQVATAQALQPTVQVVVQGDGSLYSQGSVMTAGENNTKGSPRRSKLRRLEEGKFVYSGSYAELVRLVERTMSECRVKVKKRSVEKGSIVGKCAYGINPFGITVTFSFYSAGNETRLDVAANLTDAFDTFGVCKKKVQEISDRLSDFAGIGGVCDGEEVSTYWTPDPEKLDRAPSFSKRVGVSHKGKAVTGFCLALGGFIFFLPTAIIGMIFCGIALTGMSTSNNQSGKGWAIAGIVIGFVATLIFVGRLM